MIKCEQCRQIRAKQKAIVFAAVSTAGFIIVLRLCYFTNLGLGSQIDIWWSLLRAALLFVPMFLSMRAWLHYPHDLRLLNQPRMIYALLPIVWFGIFMFFGVGLFILGDILFGN